MARLFESYVMVDWSAASKPATGVDSIWIGALTPDARMKLNFKASNPPTRAKALEELTDLLGRCLKRGDRVLLGVDFPLDGVRFEGELLRYEDDYSYTASLDGVTTCVATLSARWVTSAQINGVTDEDYTCEGPYCADLEAAGARFCGGFVEWEAVLVE